MKVAAALLTLGLAASCAFASDLPASAVPQAVKDGLTQSFEGARAHEWDFKKDDGLYKAEFNVGSREGKAYLTPEGKVVESKIDVAPDALPQHIRAAALKDFAGATIIGAHRRSKEDRVTWAVALRLANGHHKNPVYNDSGIRLD